MLYVLLKLIGNQFYRRLLPRGKNAFDEDKRRINRRTGSITATAFGLDPRSTEINRETQKSSANSRLGGSLKFQFQ